MIRVVAPSRLHFGLFRVPVAGEAEPHARAFGGVGLMVEHPGVIVNVRPAESWQFEGSLASRAQVFAARFMLGVPEEHKRPFQILIERCAPEHTGLGTGTQLALAVAKSLALACGQSHLTAPQLAERVGRGERSAIGVHGFDRGGFLVDAGKLPNEHVSPLRVHLALPAEWRVVLFTLPVASCWFGPAERQAFSSASPGDPHALKQLADVAVYAAQESQFDDFGNAIHELNRKAGEPFAAAQGGVYASREIESLIADIRATGIRGVGQSSWGPTVFAIAPDTDTAMSLVSRFRARVPAFVTRISTGHRAETTND